MDKEALSYGFKTYKDRETAIPVIERSMSGSFDDELARLNLEKTDSNYGFKGSRNALNRLESKYKISDVMSSSDGFIENQKGYTNKRPDTYMSIDGARDVSKYLKEKVLTKYDNIDKDMNSALNKEIEIKNLMRKEEEKHIKTLNILEGKIEQNNLEASIKENSDNILSRISAVKPKLDSRFYENLTDIRKSMHRKKVDKFNRKMEDVPDSVVYSRFSKSLDNAIEDGNELYNFRYY